VSPHVDNIFNPLSEYDLKNLPYHLAVLNRIEDLDCLFQKDGPGERNAWFDVNLSRGYLGDFVDHLRMARDAASAFSLEGEGVGQS
jgi:hypothetical protein